MTERQDREDWAFEVALLMRNRFMAHEVYEEWFEGRLTRSQWNEVMLESPFMKEFRQIMFKRLIPTAVPMSTPSNAIWRSSKE